MVHIRQYYFLKRGIIFASITFYLHSNHPCLSSLTNNNFIKIQSFIYYTYRCYACMDAVHLIPPLSPENGVRSGFHVNARNLSGKANSVLNHWCNPHTISLKNILWSQAGVAHTFIPSTQNVEAGRSLWVGSHPVLQELFPGQAPKWQRNAVLKNQKNKDKKKSSEIVINIASLTSVSSFTCYWFLSNIICSLSFVIRASILWE